MLWFASLASCARSVEELIPKMYATQKDQQLRRSMLRDNMLVLVVSRPNRLHRHSLSLTLSLSHTHTHSLSLSLLLLPNHFFAMLCSRNSVVRLEGFSRSEYKDQIGDGTRCPRQARPPVLPTPPLFAKELPLTKPVEFSHLDPHSSASWARPCRPTGSSC